MLLTYSWKKLFRFETFRNKLLNKIPFRYISFIQLKHYICKCKKSYYGKFLNKRKKSRYNSIN